MGYDGITVSLFSLVLHTHDHRLILVIIQLIDCKNSSCKSWVLLDIMIIFVCT